MPLSKRKLTPKDEDDPNKDTSSPLKRLKAKLKKPANETKLNKSRLRRAS